MPTGVNGNLRPFDERSNSEARDFGQIGGINSGKARREKRAACEAAQLFLSVKLPKSKDTDAIRLALESAGIPKCEQNLQLAILASQSLAAIRGDTQAARFIFDIAAESPMVQLKEREIAAKEAQNEKMSGVAPEMVKQWVDGIKDVFGPTAPERKLEDFE